ncbi:MAG: trimeric autotransporter adhesin [Anaerophaga sp.]|nr:trimeric autotransporter adhesin [Anaerophaga sp.]
MRYFTSFFCFAFLFVQSLFSQIPATWESVGGLPGVTGGSSVNDYVLAMVQDGNGNIYIAGDFEIAGGVMAHRIVKYDGAEFHPIATSVNGFIYDLAVDVNGNLFVGGSFTTIDGVTMNRVAMWDGNNWSSLGTGVGNYTVYAIAATGPGEVYVGGDFSTAGGNTASRVAHWNGTSWASMGDGFDNTVRALELSSDGKLYAGGIFMQSGTTDVSRVAYWDGTAWQPMGSGVNDSVLALESDDSGNLYVGGEFVSAGGKYFRRIAKWDGTGWSGVGADEYSGFDERVYDLRIDESGNLYACGEFSEFNNTALSGAAVLPSSGTWQSIGNEFVDGFGNVNYSLRSILPTGTGDVYVGGIFRGADGLGVYNIVRWDGVGFHTLSNGPDNSIYVSVLDPDGNLYVAGSFISAGDKLVNYIAKWDGSEFSPLGDGFNDVVYALTIDSNGTLYAGGNFTKSGTTEINRVARWSGTEWEPLGTGVDREVYVLTTNSQDELFVGGLGITDAGGVSVNNIARWDGSQWHDLDGGVNNYVRALFCDDQDNLYVGGGLTEAGNSPVTANRIAKWDGSGWTALDGGVTGYSAEVRKIISDKNGGIYVAGNFTFAGEVGVSHIAHWDGSSWSGIGDYSESYYLNNNVFDITLDAYGNLYAGGYFTTAGDNTVNIFARWDGNEWAGLDNGFSTIGEGMPSVRSIIIKNDGILYASGTFYISGLNNRVTPFLAKTILPGRISVEIEPQQAVDDGARWSYDGGTTWLEPGVYDLPAGDYNVSFKEVSGWNVPSPQNVSTAYGTDLLLSGSYETATSIPAFKDTETIKVYPVPATDWVNLVLPVSRGFVTIIDMSGIIVLDQEINSTEARIFVGDFIPGIYFMRLKVEGKIVFKKLIVK